MSSSTLNRNQISKQDHNPQIISSEEEIPLNYTSMGPFCSEQKDIGITTLILIFMACLLNTLEVIYIFDPNINYYAFNIAFISTSIPRTILFSAVGIKFAGRFKKYIFYLIMLDPIAFPMGFACYAYVTFLFNIFKLGVLDIIGMIALVFQFLTFGACHRAMVAQAKWRKWQIILYKIILIISSFFYIVNGIRYIFPGVDWTEGESPQTDQAIKQFMIMYTIGSAQFLVKLYEKLCDLDKTAHLHIEHNECGTIVVFK